MMVGVTLRCALSAHLLGGEPDGRQVLTQSCLTLIANVIW